MTTKILTLVVGKLSRENIFSTAAATERMFPTALYTQSHSLEILASEFSKFFSLIVSNREEVALSCEMESSTSSWSTSFRIDMPCLWWWQQLPAGCTSFGVNGWIMDYRQGWNAITWQCWPARTILQNPTQSIQLVASVATSFYQLSLNRTSVHAGTLDARQFGFPLFPLSRLETFKTRVRWNWELSELRWPSPDVQIFFSSVPRERITRVEFFIADII